MTKPKNPTLTSDQQAHLYFNDTYQFVKAAELLAPKWGEYFGPTFVLISHTLELALKAYILKHGGTIDQLMKQDTRHNLKRLHQIAVGVGFRASHPETADVIERLSPAHKDHSFRYQRGGGTAAARADIAVEVCQRLIHDMKADFAGELDDDTTSDTTGGTAVMKDRETAKEGEEVPDQPEGTDWFLAHLINIVEHWDVGPPLTLMVGGLLVAGQLVSGRKFFEDFQLQLESVDTGSEGSAAAESVDTGSEGSAAAALGQIGGQFADAYPKPEVSAPFAIKPVRYIHLAQVTILLPDGNLLEPRSAWRGKLSAVDGYSLGALSRR